MPERTIQALAEFLKPRHFAAGSLVFKEGGRGMSMYFVASGRIRIDKRTASGSVTELAIVGPPDFFGETALVAEVPRSATAAAAEPCLLFQLFSGNLQRWLKNSAPQALQFFAALSHVMARRLRKTSRELTLHLDLSKLLRDHQSEAQPFLREALERVVSHLDGDWSAAAYCFLIAKPRWYNRRSEEASSLMMLTGPWTRMRRSPLAAHGSITRLSALHGPVRGKCSVVCFSDRHCRYYLPKGTNLL
jgi:CRP-like cAMP-binding protein